MPQPDFQSEEDILQVMDDEAARYDRLLPSSCLPFAMPTSAMPTSALPPSAPACAVTLISHRDGPLENDPKYPSGPSLGSPVTFHSTGHQSNSFMSHVLNIGFLSRLGIQLMPTARQHSLLSSRQTSPTPMYKNSQSRRHLGLPAMPTATSATTPDMR